MGASESRRTFHDKVLDGIRKFLEAHVMRAKTGPRDFSQFETELHARLMEAERENRRGRLMPASDVDAGISRRRWVTASLTRHVTWCDPLATR